MSGANSVDFDALFKHKSGMAEEIGNLWLTWNAARIGIRNRWKETSQFLYATSTLETINGNVGGTVDDSEDEEDQGWSHTTHVPYLTSIADGLSANYMAATLPNDRFFDYQGMDEKGVMKETRDLVESYLLSKHRHSNFRNIYRRLVDDFVEYGNCFAQVYFEKQTVEEREGGTSRGYVGPRVHRISPYDIVFNVLATDFKSSPKIIRSLKTVGELMREIDEQPDSPWDMDAVQNMLDIRGALQQIGTEEYDKYLQMQYDGYGSASQYLASGHVEVLDFYGDIYDFSEQKFYKNHWITVVDKQFVIQRSPTPTWDGKPLIFHAGWRTRPDNLWAMGPLDNLIGMQYLINHLENARADMFDQMIAPTRVLIGDVEKVDITPGKPGGEYRVPTAEGDVKNLLPDTTVLNADLQIQNKMEQMERFAGQPREELGIRTPGEKTLGEVQHLHAAASKLFKNKSMDLETFLEQILNAELEVARRNPAHEDTVAVLGEDGVTEFLEVSSDDLKSNGKLVPVGIRHYERKQQAVANFQLLQQAIQQDPMIATHMSSVKMAEVFSELMELDLAHVFSPYVRVGEETQLQRLMQAAQTQLENEDAVSIGDEEDEEETVGPPIA